MLAPICTPKQGCTVPRAPWPALPEIKDAAGKLGRDAYQTIKEHPEYIGGPITLGPGVREKITQFIKGLFG